MNNVIDFYTRKPFKRPYNNTAIPIKFTWYEPTQTRTVDGGFQPPKSATNLLFASQAQAIAHARSVIGYGWIKLCAVSKSGVCSEKPILIREDSGYA